jgi:hypothetical protein
MLEHGLASVTHRPRIVRDDYGSIFKVTLSGKETTVLHF